jgi:hypothetical protein
LLVEDNVSDVGLLKRALKKAGVIFTLKVVEGRNDFINELASFGPDIILSGTEEQVDDILVIGVRIN